MTAVAPIKKNQDSDAQTFGLGDKYRTLIFKQRSICLGDVAMVAVGKRIQVDSYIDGVPTAITRCSPSHFRVEIGNGQSFIVAEEAVQVAIELRAPAGPTAA